MLPILCLLSPLLLTSVRGDLSSSGNVTVPSTDSAPLPDLERKAGKFLDVSGSDPFSPKLARVQAAHNVPEIVLSHPKLVVHSPSLFFLRFFWCGPCFKSLLNFFNIASALSFRVFFFLALKHEILVPQLGISPYLPAMEGQVLTTGPSGKSHPSFCISV